MQGSAANSAAAATRSLPRPELKTGPWSPEEDEILRDHVRKHGAAAWSSLRSRGLNRSASTCRCRWACHIDPDRKAYVCIVVHSILIYLFSLLHS